MKTYGPVDHTGNGDMWYRGPYNRTESGYREYFLYLDLTNASCHLTKSRGYCSLSQLYPMVLDLYLNHLYPDTNYTSTEHPPTNFAQRDFG